MYDCQNSNCPGAATCKGSSCVTTEDWILESVGRSTSGGVDALVLTGRNLSAAGTINERFNWTCDARYVLGNDRYCRGCDAV